MSLTSDEIEVHNDPLWDDVLGQETAVAQLQASAANPVHAYLFLGPKGSGRLAAAKGFAAMLLSHGLDGEAAERAQRLAKAGTHPDLVQFKPSGRALRMPEVKPIITEASRSPVEANRKVILIHEFQAAEGVVAASLLKTIEEPEASTIMVLLSEDVPPDHITIASRCSTIEFFPIAHNLVVHWLRSRGADPDRADMVATAAQGDLDRAELLLTDVALAERHQAWMAVPEQLNGTGARATQLVDQLRQAIDAAQGALDERHAGELEALAEREEQFGTRGSGRADLIAQHKREIRRHRDDEIRFGLAVLAGQYRDRLVVNPTPAGTEAVARLRIATTTLQRNPNEELLLQSLFLDLPVL